MSNHSLFTKDLPSKEEIDGKVLELLLILYVHYLAAADGASMSVVT